ncbi:hypothetical protein FSARC_7516 [Fusarium sarcochroum]|uniref:Zn(2)-C6 fungal-type domain-containing protein n=1 Tax=Fusarium sarcochroum TaxID=1208366 RepID=A0A8H4TV24_9HYPO|nr:hypothetical protein FSARC_7516 [Fusarium sarcochroum]
MMKGNQRKVSSACERCRKQKLKCDVERPCTLCTRANVECIAPSDDRWKIHKSPFIQAGTTGQEPTAKRRRLDHETTNSTTSVINPSPPGDNVDPVVETSWNSSSTIKLVEEAFQHHEAISPEGPETSALSSATWVQPNPTVSSNSYENKAPGPLKLLLSQHLRGPQGQQNTNRTRPSVAEQELSALLPQLEPATILIDNYFDRIHWFMLLFHQDDCRKKFQDLYASGPHPSHISSQIAGRIGYVAVLLAALATSLDHISDAQNRLLQSHDIEPHALKENILAALKLRFLDIVSLGSLEAVQFCVLLGSYYLYHGEPEMAWPLCGSGLRIAQALNLHRQMPSQDQVPQHVIEDRKRAWWAVYEIETFCSMLYGFPLGFSDSDCNVEPLNPYDQYSGSTAEAIQTRQPTLLFFKCSMSTLSAIVKSALVDLYGARGNQQDPSRASVPGSLVNKVSALNQKLLGWDASLPQRLRFYTPSSDTTKDCHARGDSNTSEREFEDHLFRLQALSLKLAYENARILIHRPLLSFRMIHSPSPTQGDTQGRADPFRLAMHECRDAALQISQVSSSPYLKEASDTYAIAFVSLHLLTAGVTLCISISLDPLSHNSFESRLGMRRLMQVQSLLKDKSIVASQGLDIIKKLMSLVMAKEVDAMFETEPPSTAVEQTRTSIHIHGDQGKDIIRNSREGSEQRPISLESDVPTNAFLNPQSVDYMNNDMTDAGSMTFEGQNFDFCENNFLNEALLEYEQATSFPFVGDTISDQDDAAINNPSFGQNQGWIWGWNFLE